MGLPGLVTRPISVAVDLGRGAIGLTGLVVGEIRSVIDAVLPGGGAEEAPAPVEVPLADPRPGPPAATAPPPSAEPAVDLAEPPPPAPPAVPPEAKIIDDEPVPVAEFGEPGAEDDAGPEVNIAEPWEGYSSMTAAEVRGRIEDASQEELATVALYEGAHRRRREVMDAAERRLAKLAASN